MKRVALIVGSAGQDGTLLSQHLAERAYDVVGLARGDIDIEDPKEVERFVERIGPTEIYFLAARHHSSEASAETEGELFHESMRIHFDAPVNFMAAIAASRMPIKFLYAASSRIFRARKDVMHDENMPLEPDSIYGITKAVGVMACRHFRQVHRVFASAAILYNHESPLRSEKFVSRKVALGVAQIARTSKGKIELGNLEACVDWGYAPDYVDAMRRILSLPHSSDFVVATGTGHTVKEFVEIAFAHVGLDYRDHVVVKSASVENTAAPRIGNSTKLRNATGWKPTLSFAEMVRRLVDSEVSRTNAS